MPIINCKCPKCKEDLSFDDSNKMMFCCYCGAKLDGEDGSDVADNPKASKGSEFHDADWYYNTIIALYEKEAEWELIERIIKDFERNYPLDERLFECNNYSYYHCRVTLDDTKKLYIIQHPNYSTERYEAAISDEPSPYSACVSEEYIDYKVILSEKLLSLPTPKGSKNALEAHVPGNYYSEEEKVFNVSYMLKYSRYHFDPTLYEALEYMMDAECDPAIKEERRKNIKTFLDECNTIRDRFNILDAEFKTKKCVDACYVATAVYGSYDCPEVWVLRRFRDYTLDETWYGRAFIKCYYAISPTIVRWFGKNSVFISFNKRILDSFVRKLQGKGIENTPYKDKQYK